MLAYTYVNQGQFALLDKPKPILQDERDAIVRVTLASICTSDLHIKHGSVPRAVPGITVGHEMGSGAGRHCGNCRPAWGPGRCQCGDILWAMLFLPARLGKQLYRP